MSCPVTVRLGVYALGAADAAERLLVESHLPNCQVCQMELAQFEPLPRLLAQVPEGLLLNDGSPGWRHSADASRSPARAAGTGKAQGLASRWRTAVGVTAAVLLLAVGGIWLAQPGASRPVNTAPRATVKLSVANPVTHVRVTATLIRTSWGTLIRLVAWGLPLNQPCRLIVRSRAGATEVTGAWDAWRAGPVRVPASAAWRLGNIGSLQIATPGRTLVTVPVPPPRGRADAPAGQAQLTVPRRG